MYSHSIGVVLPSLSRAYRVDDKTLVAMPRVCSSSMDIVMSEFAIDIRKVGGAIATFVRNPFDRLISAYAQFWSDLSFENFVYRLINDSPQDVHLLKQCDLVQANWVGRFENLEEDWPRCCEWLGIEPRPLEHKNKTVRKPFAWYFDSPILIQRVADYYKDDFEAYGYRPEDI